MRKSKNIETHVVPNLAPRVEAEAEAVSGAEARGPSLGTKWVSIFFDFRISWNHPRFQVFMQKYSWNHQKFPRNEWNQVTKKKERFLFKTGSCYIEIVNLLAT